MNKTPDQQVDELIAGLKMILLPQAPNAIQRKATEKELDSLGESHNKVHSHFVSLGPPMAMLQFACLL